MSAFDPFRTLALATRLLQILPDCAGRNTPKEGKANEVTIHPGPACN